MKKVFVFLLLAATLSGYGQADTASYMVVYKPGTQIVPVGGVPTYVVFFRTQAQVTTFLNEQLDSTANVVGAYDVRTKKPLKLSYTTVVEEKVITERRRKRRYDVRT